MKPLAVYIVQGSQRMMKPIDFQAKWVFFAQLPFAFVFGIEETRVRIPHPVQDFLGRRCLRQEMKVRGQQAIGQEGGIRCQGSQRQCIETPNQVGFTSKKDFVVGRQTEVIDFLHRSAFESLLRRYHHILPIAIA